MAVVGKIVDVSRKLRDFLRAGHIVLHFLRSVRTNSHGGYALAYVFLAATNATQWASRAARSASPTWTASDHIRSTDVRFRLSFWRSGS